MDQIPELLSDIILPDYCSFGVSDNIDGGNSMTFNLFIGPSDTISPLHTDPRHNFFCQVIFLKIIFKYYLDSR